MGVEGKGGGGGGGVEKQTETETQRDTEIYTEIVQADKHADSDRHIIRDIGT